MISHWPALKDQCSCQRELTCLKFSTVREKQRPTDRWNERCQWFIACQRTLWGCGGGRKRTSASPREQWQFCSLEHYSCHMRSACWCDVLLVFQLVPLHRILWKQRVVALNHAGFDCQANNFRQQNKYCCFLSACWGYCGVILHRQHVEIPWVVSILFHFLYKNTAKLEKTVCLFSFFVIFTTDENNTTLMSVQEIWVNTSIWLTKLNKRLETEKHLACPCL